MASKFEYISNDGKRGSTPKWIQDASDFVKTKFSENNHNFILIPTTDVDNMTSEHRVGTCITDTTDPVAFALGMAGAICSFSLTSDSGGKKGEATLIARNILQMVKEVDSIKGERNGK